VEVSESRTVQVCARERWNDTGIDLRRGEAYLMQAAGHWRDRDKKTDAGGYDSKKLALRLTTWLRRCPRAPWFALIGALAADRKSFFVIGRRCEYRARDDGRLRCFANDVPFAYGNNHGSIELTVTRTA
jgi:hypothetical protein